MAGPPGSDPPLSPGFIHSAFGAVDLWYVWVQTTAIVAAIERQVVAIGGGHVPTDIQLNSVFEPDITWLQEPGALHD